MKSYIFDLITSPLSLFENPIYDFIVMGIIGYIAYKVAFCIVGDLGLRGESGSIAHWTIRFVVLVLIWFICCILINIVLFIIDNLISIVICLLLIITLILGKKYADKNPNSKLNRKIL